MKKEAAFYFGFMASTACLAMYNVHLALVVVIVTALMWWLL